jgi:hypothetical protein
MRDGRVGTCRWVRVGSQPLAAGAPCICHGRQDTCLQAAAPAAGEADGPKAERWRAVNSSGQTCCSAETPLSMSTQPAPIRSQKSQAQAADGAFTAIVPV